MFILRAEQESNNNRLFDNYLKRASNTRSLSPLLSLSHSLSLLAHTHTRTQVLQCRHEAHAFVSCSTHIHTHTHTRKQRAGEVGVYVQTSWRRVSSKLVPHAVRWPCRECGSRHRHRRTDSTLVCGLHVEEAHSHSHSHSHCSSRSRSDVSANNATVVGHLHSLCPA